MDKTGRAVLVETVEAAYLSALDSRGIAVFEW
jgi:hypothetical protein